ncbi:MAG TPA: phage holin family protein [Polyangia bacterium]|nr:phage holin family protein [Polyangia bacterium]
MAILQALLALISKTAGKVLNAIFGWAVRALFGQTTAREQTFLSVIVGAAVAWPILLIGVIAPKVAALLIAFVPIPHWIPSWIVRLVWLGLALFIPIGVGIAVAVRSPPSLRHESQVVRVLRGFPITIGLAGAFVIMFVSVPIMRLAALARREKSADVPLITDAAAYHEVAAAICRVLNRHGFSFRPAAPGWWVAAPTRLLTVMGGDAFRAYVPARLEHFVSDGLEMSIYPSGLLLRGRSNRLTWAHGLVAETVVHTEGLQTTAPEAQALERRLRRIWKSHDADPTGAGTAGLERDLDQVTHDLGELDVDFDDWQVVYRQILQVGRSIHGQRQLLDIEAPRVVEAGGRAGMDENRGTGDDDLRQLSARDLVRQIGSQAEALVTKQIALAKAELKKDLRTEATAAGGLGVAAVLALLSLALLLVTGALGLALLVPAWAAGLIVSGLLLAATAIVALVSWRKRIARPMDRTRRTLKGDLEWAKGRLT